MSDTSQLSLLGALGVPAPGAKPGDVTWVEHDAPGRLGFLDAAALDAADALAELGAGVLLIASSVTDEQRERLRTLHVDLRHLAASATSPSEARERQIEALAADLRHGRRTVVIADPADGALLAACALVHAGVGAAAALAAVGVGELDGGHRAAVLRYAEWVERSRAARAERDRTGSSAGAITSPGFVSSVGLIASPEPERARGRAVAAAGAMADGATADGATADGATADGATADGATADGATADGATADGGTEDGGTADGATADGGTADAGTADGATADGATADGGTADAATADGTTDASTGDATASRAPTRASSAGGLGERPSTPSEPGEPRGSPSPPGATILRLSHPSPARAEESASPPAVGLAARVVGAVLGAAIGDAMGAPAETIESFEALDERFGPEGIRGYAGLTSDGGRPIARFTDDTVMTELTLRALVRAKREGLELDAAMRDLAARFVEWSRGPREELRDASNACLVGCRHLGEGVPWDRAGGERAAGGGSVVRAYPFGLAFADDVARAEAWSIAQSKMTHRDPIALAACAAMAVGIARLVRGEPLRLALSEMIAAAVREDASTGAAIALALRDAERGVPPRMVLDRLRGWSADEAIAAAVYVIARHPGDARAAILEASFSPGDSDGLASLVGALIGAHLGVDALEPTWIRDLERTGELRTLAEALTRG
ncbi:MAG: ADP-ribosylglycohydrolase family protein [Sandaracinaceae bacterium]